MADQKIYAGGGSLKKFKNWILSKYYNKDATDSLLEGKSDTSHIHDERYYTKSVIDSEIISQKANIDNGNVIIGSDIESGYINVKNVNKGEDAIYWHLDAFDNTFRFVRNGNTVPVAIDEHGIYGAKYMAVVLLDNISFAGTISLKDNISNYDFLIIYWIQAGVSTSSTVILTPSLIHRHFQSNAICVSTEKNYCTFVFPSDTTIKVVDSNVSSTVNIIGYKGV